MEYRFSSETKTIYLDVPYKLMITSDTGPALGNDGKGKLHAVVRNTKTGADVSFDSSCFTWTRREDSSNFTPVNSDTLDLTLDDLVYGGYANFVVSFEKSGLYWKDTTFFTMSKTTKGEDGAAGYSQATVTLYKRSSEEQTKYDGEVLTYVFSTGGVTGSTGTWSRTVPSGDEKLWVISASAFANSTEDEIEVDDWTSPAVLSENGTVGQDGYTVLTVILYQRSKTKPAKPTGASTYYFDTNTISGVEPWTITVPDGTEPVWVTSATAATRLEVHDDISADEWSEPQMLVKNGDDGISSYTYIRYSDDNGATFTENGGTVVGEYMGVCVTTASTAPSDVSSYTWSKTKGETGDKGDSITISEKSIQYASSASGTVAPTAWSDTPSPVKGQYLWTRTYVKYSDNTENTSYSVAYVATDGKNSLGVYRAFTALSTSSTSVNASNIATKPSRDWMVGDTIIDTNGLGFAVTIATSLSSSTIPIGYRFNIKGEQGEKGDKGDKGDEGDPAPYTRQIYCASEKKPDTPTETCDQVPSGWSLQIPTRTETQVHWISMGVVSVKDGVYEYSTWSEPAKYTADESGIVPIVQWKWGSSDTINPDEEDNTISLGDGTLLEVNGQAVTISQNSGTGWSNTIPAYSDDKPYLWKREWRYASEGVDAGWVYYCVTGKQGVEGSYNSLGYKIDGSSITFAGLDRDGIPSLGSFRANLGGEVVAFQRTVFTITSDLDGNYHDRYFLVAHWTSTVGTLSLCYLVPVSETDDDGNTTYRMKWVAQDGTEITTTSVDGTAYDPYVLADIRMVSGASIKSVTLVNPAKLKAYESDYFMTIMSQGDMTDVNAVAKALDIERVFERVAAMEAFINKLFANEITITNTLDVNYNISKYGSIHSSGYNKLDYTDESKKGFYLESTGYAEFSKAILKDATIESRDSDDLPILATSKSYDPFEMAIHEEATYWKLDDLFSNVDIKKYGYIEFTSDYEAIHAPLSTHYELYNSIVNRFDRANMFSSVSFEYEFTVDFDISKIRLYLFHQFTKIADTSSMNDSGIYVNDVLVSSGEWVVDTTKYDEYKTSSWGFAYKEWQYSYYIAKADLTTGEIAAGSKIKIKINVTDSAGAVMFNASDSVDIYANPNNFEAINGLESDYTASTRGYVLFQKKANSISLLSSYIFTYWNPKEHMLALDNFDSNYYAVYRPIDNGFLSKIYNQLTQYVIYKCDSTKSYLTYNNETIKVNSITREEYSVIVNSEKVIPADSVYAFDAYIYVPEGEGVLVTKTILPASSNAYDLGSETSKFRNIYVENLYPVGSFYFSTRPISPASMYGGTWVELDGDRTLWFVSHTDGTTTYLEDGTGDNLRPQKDDGALPALSGWFTTQGNDNTSVGRQGCDGGLFQVRNTGTVDSGTSGGSDYANSISFDAKRYNSIYGKLGSVSSIVRPTNYKVYAWWRRA